MLSGAYRFPAMESVVYGRPFAEALKEAVEESGANAVFLLASGTLARETGMPLQRLGSRGSARRARFRAQMMQLETR